MERKRLFYISGQAIMGGAAVLIGALLLLDNFDVLDARLFLRFWPVILIVFGTVRVLNSSHRGGRFWGSVFILIGAILLVRELGVTYVGFRELWPLIFVLLGLSMLLGGTARGKVPGTEGPAQDSHSTVNAFAVLGGVQQSNNSQDFRGGESSAIMGGCEIDLRQASIQGEEAVISTFAMWGGIKIKVPPAWHVTMQGVPFLGGFDDKSAKPSDPAAKRLVVKGTAIMGGVEVTN
jgi:predicted membrane protein